MIDDIISNMKTRIIVAAIGAASIMGYAGCSGGLTEAEIPKYAKKETCCETKECRSIGYDGCTEWTMKFLGNNRTFCDCFKYAQVADIDKNDKIVITTVKEYSYMNPPKEIEPTSRLQNRERHGYREGGGEKRHVCKPTPHHTCRGTGERPYHRK